MKAKEIRQRILKNLDFLLPTLEISKVQIEEKISDQMFDLVLKIKTQKRREWLLVCEISELLQPRMAREISAQFKEKIANLNRDKVYPIVITAFLGERTREILKKEGLGYMDLAGNCYLEFNNIYIEKIVDKNPFVDKRKIKTIFRPISSRIPRVLLEKPKKGWKILKLSKVAGVSLGQASNVCRWLIDEEYLKKDRNGFYVLTEPGKLLDEWRENYTYSQNKISSYYSFEQKIEKLIKKVKQFAGKEDLRYALTLLSGASYVAPFVRGISSLQMYASDNEAISKWVRLLDLRPVESGANVSIYIPYDRGIFYETQIVNGIKIVCNIQLYLDLYNYPTRGKEQAEFLRREKIKF